MSEDGEKDPPFANSREAFEAIKETCAWAVAGCLHENKVSDAVRCAMMMQAVEKILKGEAVEMVAND